jgi:hypothetical protein
MEDSADEKYYSPNVRSYPNSIFNVSAHILCIDKLLKEFEKLEDSERMKFTLSFTTNLISRHGYELTSSAFKENVTEPKF